MKLKKYKEPILKPNKEIDWEKEAVYNPGAICMDEKIYLLYRAVGEYTEYSSKFGLAISRDGIKFERISEKPVFEGKENYDKGGVEDPRIIKLEDRFLITYAALPKSPGETGPISEIINKLKKDLLYPRLHVFSHTALLESKDLRNFKRLGVITPLDIDDRDGIIFPEKINGKYVMIHRPTEWVGDKYGTDRPSMWIRYSDDLINWHDDKLLLKPEFNWERRKIGAGGPPMKSDAGWILFYHGVDESYVYRAGIAIVDLDKPERVLVRFEEPVLEPEEEWEKFGDIPNVVFPTANVLIDDEIFIYYGGADKVCCLATVKMKKLLEEAMKYRRNPPTF